MSRSYPHRYKVLTGYHAGLVSDGQRIGYQDFPDQFVNMTNDQIMQQQRTMRAAGVYEGIWLNELQMALHRPIPVTGVSQPKIEITEEGVNYDNVYMDLCVPFDRYGNEIKEGDTIMIASKNEVRRAKVIKIAKRPFMASYGITNRKLTVRDEEEEQTLTINDPRATVKI